MSVCSSDGDVWLHEPPVAPWVPASLLEQVPGVGMAAAGHGHAPDRRYKHSLPKLWHGRPSAVQPELPGLHPCCRQRGTHSLPQHRRAQVERCVWERGAEGEKRTMISPDKKIGVAEVLMKRDHRGGQGVALCGAVKGAKDCLKPGRWWICCLLLLEWVS